MMDGTRLPVHRGDIQAELGKVRAELTKARAELVDLRVFEAELLMLLAHAENQGGNVISIQAIRQIREAGQ